MNINDFVNKVGVDKVLHFSIGTFTYLVGAQLQIIAINNIVIKLFIIENYNTKVYKINHLCKNISDLLI